MYKIEKNIEMPKDTRKKIPRFPFHEMDVGDSFCFPSSERPAVSSYASRYGKLHEVKFSVRIVDDKNYRVWRVK